MPSDWDRMPVMGKVRITPNVCAYCSWRSRERPRQAWLLLNQHHRAQHPGEEAPAPPDQLAVLRGEWEHAAVQYRESGATGDLSLEVSAAVALGDYLREHDLTDTPANPHFEWMTAMRAYELRLAWETARLEQASTTASEGAADAALVELVEFLEAHGVAGGKYDPRGR